MAVIKHARLSALTSAALALPGMIENVHAATALLAPEADFNFAYYNEGGNRMEVEVYELTAKTPVGKDFEVSFNGVRDVITGASPIYNMPVNTNAYPGAPGLQTISCASGSICPPPNPGGNTYSSSRQAQQVITPFNFSDERRSVDVGVKYFIDDYTLGINGSTSHEKDYVSNSGGFNIQRDLNNKNTSLNFAFNYADDEINPSNRKSEFYNKNSAQYLLGVSQVLSKKTLWQGNVSMAVEDGYLTDPYKMVYVMDEGILYDKRPDNRYRWSFFNKFIHYLTPLDAALHFDYRYTIDSWQIDSHMFQLTLYQSIMDSWQLVPNVRYYSQNAAYFYQPFFDSVFAQNAYSSDYRLAQYGAISGGLRLVKHFDSHLKLDIGFDYYSRQSDLAFSGNTQNSFADFSYTLTTASISYRF